MADPAVFHFNFNIFRLQLAGIVFPQRQIGARFFGGVAFNDAHVHFLGVGVITQKV